MNKEYSRRDFLRKNSVAGFGMIGAGAFGGSLLSTDAFANDIENAADIKKISELNLKKLRDTYMEALLGKFIPNMDNYVVDHELGGFMCSIDIRSKKLISTTKRAWFEGRGIWMYSFLYNTIEKKPRYLEIATKSKNFILKLLPKDGTYYISSFTKEGIPVGNVEGDIYGNLFVAEGLAEYSKAIGDKRYFDQAKDIILKAVERYDRPDFTYAYKAENRLAGPRILGHWMILLSLSTQMLRQHADTEIRALADRCVDAIMNHHLNPEFKLLNEALAHDMSQLTDPVASQYGDIGHGCETLAFVMNYAVRIKDAKLFKRASAEFKRHVDIAWDDIYGGYFHVLENVSTNTWALNKLRWLQEEILIGALILIEHTGDEWALNCFAKTEAYIREKYVRPEYAFVIDSGDRKMEKHTSVRAEHYHYPRQLMVSILAIDRILKRGEKPSGIFS
jgi:mannose/cellobiose epimerase-like protein (N-acyl-D-glucosamine 2-epimerase family)